MTKATGQVQRAGSCELGYWGETREELGAQGATRRGPSRRGAALGAGEEGVGDVSWVVAQANALRWLPHRAARTGAP